MPIVRKATEKDIDALETLYDEIHTAEEENKQQIGWIRGYILFAQPLRWH